MYKQTLHAKRNDKPKNPVFSVYAQTVRQEFLGYLLYLEEIAKTHREGKKKIKKICAHTTCTHSALFEDVNRDQRLNEGIPKLRITLLLLNHS